MQGLLAYLITFAIIFLIGRWAYAMVDAGYYVVLPMLLIGALGLGWLVGTESDRDEYRAIGRKIAAGLRRGSSPPAAPREGSDAPPAQHGGKRLD